MQAANGHSETAAKGAAESAVLMKNAKAEQSAAGVPEVEGIVATLALNSERLGLGASGASASLSLQSDTPRRRLPLLTLLAPVSSDLSRTCVTTIVHSHPTPISQAKAGSKTTVGVGTSAWRDPRPSWPQSAAPQTRTLPNEVRTTVCAAPHSTCERMNERKINSRRELVEA